MPTVNEANEKLSIAECSEHWQTPKEAECMLWDRHAVLSYCIISVDLEWSLQVSKRITTQLNPYSIVLLEKLTVAHGVILWVHIFHYRFHSSPSLVCNRSDEFGLHRHIRSLQIQFTLALRRLKLPSVLLLSDVLSKILHAFLMLSMHATCPPPPSYSLWFSHPNNIWFRVQIIKLIIK
jgi:hypothetical protein